MAKINRRSVLSAIGLVGVGTGAAFGSGAFTSTTAEREVEVNVFGDVDDNAGEGAVAGNTAQADQEDIADAITNNSIDVLVDLTSDSIGVRLQDGSASLDELVTDGSDLFPNPQDGNDTVYADDSAPNFPNDESNYVSLVANDVTIVFGSGGLPPNSTVGFNDVFAFADPNSNSGPLEATFETSDPNNEALLTDIGDNGNPSDGEVTVRADIDNGQTEDAGVDTGTVDGETENLSITIE